MRDDSDSTEGPGSNRRAAARVEVTWAVDCQTPDTFLYASISNISALGIFVRTTEPLPVGTRVTLRFTPPEGGELVVQGQVQWVNALRPFSENRNPGMGVRFVELSAEQREQLVRLVRTMAYVHDSAN